MMRCSIVRMVDGFLLIHIGRRSNHTEEKPRAGDLLFHAFYFRHLQPALFYRGLDDVSVIKLNAQLFRNTFTDGMSAGTVFSADGDDHC